MHRNVTEPISAAYDRCHWKMPGAAAVVSAIGPHVLDRRGDVRRDVEFKSPDAKDQIARFQTERLFHRPRSHVSAAMRNDGKAHAFWNALKPQRPWTTVAVDPEQIAAVGIEATENIR